MQSPFTLLLQGTFTSTNSTNAGSAATGVGNQIGSGEKVELATQLTADAPRSGFAVDARGDNFAGIYAEYSETLQPETQPAATQRSNDLAGTQANNLLEPELSLLASGPRISGQHQSSIASADLASKITSQSSLAGTESGATLPQTGRSLPLFTHADATGNTKTVMAGLQASTEPELNDTLTRPPGEKPLSVDFPHVEPIAAMDYSDPEGSFGISKITAEPSIANQASVGLVDARTTTRNQFLAQPTTNQSMAQQSTEEATAEVRPSGQETTELLLSPVNPQSAESRAAGTIQTTALTAEAVRSDTTSDTGTEAAIETAIETKAPTIDAILIDQNSNLLEDNQSPVAGPVTSINQFIARAKQNQPPIIDAAALEPAKINGTAALPVSPAIQLTKEANHTINVEVAQEAQNQQARPLPSPLFEPSTANRRDGVQSGVFPLANSNPSLSATANLAATADMTMANIVVAEPSLQDFPDGQSDLATVAKRPEAGGQHPISSSLNGAAATEKLQTFDGPLSFNRAGWSEALSQRINVLLGKNIEQAQIQLDPPELGSLQVKINMQGDQVSVQFTSAHGVVREALDQTSARLAQLFNEEGIELLDVSVSDGKGEGDRSSQSEGGNGEDIDSDLPVNDENFRQLTISRPDNGQIDYFV